MDYSETISPGRCWANIDTSNLPCSSGLIRATCKGGTACVHRSPSEIRQCPNEEKTRVGLCKSCWKQIFA